jgi:hypothetical protein
MYTVDCDAAADFPKITITISGSKLEIDPRNFIVDLGFEDNTCPLALDMINRDYAKYENYMLGTPFARQFCLQYDWDKEEMRVYATKN